MSLVNRYRLWCDDEQNYVYLWAEEEPTKCPNDTSHVIAVGKTTIVEVSDENEVVIKEENIKTGGHYQGQGFEFNVPAVVDNYSFDISFPIPISILSAEWCNKSDYAGDGAEFQIAPNTITGNITQSVSIDDDVINVSTTVIENTAVGYWIDLFDGTKSFDCGRVLEIDTDNKTITVENPVDSEYLATSPTYVRQTVKMIPNLILSGSARTQLGESKIGGSYLPPNIVIRLIYKNLTGTAKKFSFILEYLY